MQKQYYLLVDTETTNKRYCLDLGLYVIDSKGKIEFKKHIVVSEIAKFPLFSTKADPNYSSKKQFYKKLRMLESRHYEKRKINEINKLFLWINEKFNNPIFCAYNAPFDRTALIKTSIDVNIFTRQYCLYNQAKAILNNSATYTRFCLENGYITKTGKLKLSAEIVGRYIYNDITYQEKHTSFDDLILERDIFIYLQKQKKAKTIKVFD